MESALRTQFRRFDHGAIQIFLSDDTVLTEKMHVPDTFQFGAISPFSAFLASRKIRNLRVFNKPKYSDSPRLHHKKPLFYEGFSTSLGTLQRRCNGVSGEI
jgi:hypothetical protein